MNFLLSAVGYLGAAVLFFQEGCGGLLSETSGGRARGWCFLVLALLIGQDAYLWALVEVRPHDLPTHGHWVEVLGFIDGVAILGCLAAACWSRWTDEREPRRTRQIATRLVVALLCVYFVGCVTYWVVFVVASAEPRADTGVVKLNVLIREDWKPQLSILGVWFDRQVQDWMLRPSLDAIRYVRAEVYWAVWTTLLYGGCLLGGLIALYRDPIVLPWRKLAFALTVGQVAYALLGPIGAGLAGTWREVPARGLLIVLAPSMYVVAEYPGVVRGNLAAAVRFVPSVAKLFWGLFADAVAAWVGGPVRRRKARSDAVPRATIHRVTNASAPDGSGAVGSEVGGASASPRRKARGPSSGTSSPRPCPGSRG